MAYTEWPSNCARTARFCSSVCCGHLSDFVHIFRVCSDTTPHVCINSAFFSSCVIDSYDADDVRRRSVRLELDPVSPLRPFSFRFERTFVAVPLGLLSFNFLATKLLVNERSYRISQTFVTYISCRLSNRRPCSSHHCLLHLLCSRSLKLSYKIREMKSKFE